jgi:hypothetical protein
MGKREGGGLKETMGRRVLLKETQDGARRFDAEISFLPGAANEYRDRQISGEEQKNLSDDIFENLFAVLKKIPEEQKIRYKGVDLLWCFKKSLYDYLDYAAQRYRAVKKILEKNLADHCFVEKLGAGCGGPSLYQILSAGELIHHPRIHETDTRLGTHRKSLFSLPGFLKSRLWPAEIKCGMGRGLTVIIYSDDQRSKSVVHCLEPARTVYWVPRSAPLLYLKCLRRGLPYFQKIPTKRQINRYRSVAAGLWEILSGQQPFQGMRIGEVDAGSLLTTKLRELFEHELPNILFNIDSAGEFFRTNPSLKSVLLDEDITPDRNAFCQAARGQGLRTFVECHGHPVIRTGFVPLTADFICAWGREQAAKLVRWGCDARRVIVTGCSRYRQYEILSTDRVRKRLVKKYRLDPGMKIVLVGLRPVEQQGLFFDDTIRDAIGSILGVIKDFREAQFIVKLHPADRYRWYYEKVLKRRKRHPKVVIVKQADPMMLAKAADFLIAYSSTFAVDGFAMKKNVILYTDRLESPLAEFDKYDIFHKAQSPDELHNALERLVKEPERRKGRWPEAEKECLNQTASQIPEQAIANA